MLDIASNHQVTTKDLPNLRLLSRLISINPPLGLRSPRSLWEVNDPKSSVVLTFRTTPQLLPILLISLPKPYGLPRSPDTLQPCFVLGTKRAESPLILGKSVTTE
jgi:hypothetical protein